MLLNFQKQFAIPVWSGKKRQTIRSAGQRKDRPVPGQLAHCYTGLRTVNTQLLGKWTITSADVIRMTIDGNGVHDVVLGPYPLGFIEFDALAKADGFKDGAAMQDWFERNHPPGEFYGWVIRWEWNSAGCGPRPIGVDS